MLATPAFRHTLRLGLAIGAAALSACGVSTQQEIQLGRQYAAEINRQLPIVEQPAIHRYINQLGNRIRGQSGDRDIPYTFYVVNTKEVNAFSIPGGYVYVNRGLIEDCDNMAELAGVVAHEIGHVEARHGVKLMEKRQAAQVGTAVASILLGIRPSSVPGAAITLGTEAYLAHYSRSDENQADSIAVQLLARAGIDPDGLATLFNKLLAQRQRAPSTLEQLFSTHPLTEERITHVREVISRLPPRETVNLQVNSPEFQAFKARVQQLPPPSPQSQRH